MNAERFSGRLKELREQAGLSQKALAEKAGLATSAIGHLEQGLRKPTWETVLALADALGVTCEAFTVSAESEAPRPRGRPKKAAAKETPPSGKKSARKRQ
jgi:transcriptional regulator with XRE-family HTH domain